MKRLFLIIACCLLVASTASAQQLRSPHQSHRSETQLPKHWKAWIIIGRCEMPAGAVPGYYERNHVDPQARRRSVWHGIAWAQDWSTKFRGGLGFTQLSWEMFRPRSARHIKYMSQATPIQQLWAAEILWTWANKTYPGNGWTAWECAGNMGWRTSDPNDLVRIVGWK